MPMIHAVTNAAVSPAQQETIRRDWGEAIALLPGKSEKWLMLEIEGQRCLYFAGTDAPCAMVHVSLYGKSAPDAYDALTQRITETIHHTLSIPKDRIYVAYHETDHWGWNGANF
ncbi:MAG: hypothetical protein IJ246_10425 [Clostridia bacterium]|nr:hypothetical protein [Clostridia bacterium]